MAAEAPPPGGDGATRHATRRSLLRSAGVMTAMTLLSRVLGLVREQVRAHYLGTSAASDAFGVATMFPNLFRRLFAEGAMTAAFLPVLVEYLKTRRPEELRAFLSKFITFLTTVIVLVTTLGVLSSGWLIDTFFSSQFRHVPGKVALTISLTRLMWPYLAFITTASVFQAVLNAHKIFGPSAFTPVLLNLAIIGCGVGLSETLPPSILPDPAYALVAGFLLGGVLQILFQIPYMLRWTRVRFGVDFRFRHPGVRRVILIMVPGAFSAGIYQINVAVSQVIASGLHGGSIASLQYSVRLQELVLGLFVVSIAQVILPTLAEQTATEDTEGVKDTLAYATGLMAFVTLPATVGLILAGPPIIRLLFQFGEFDAKSTAMTAYALNFHALGLFAIAAMRVYQTVFYAYKDQLTPLLLAAVAMVVNIVGCLVLSGPLSHGGIALAGSIAAAVNAVLLVVMLRRRLGSLSGHGVLARLGRMAAATAVMTAALLGLERLWPHEAIASRAVLGGWVAAALAVAGATYVLSARALGVDELDMLWRALARKLRRR